MDTGSLRFVGFVLIVLITVAVASFTPAGQPVFDVVQGMQPCTVGVKGTTATISVTGWKALESCNMIARNLRGGYLGAPPSGDPVRCEVDRGNARLVVRDDGRFRVNGETLCDRSRVGQ